jgi:hypothetical protein
MRLQFLLVFQYHDKAVILRIHREGAMRSAIIQLTSLRGERAITLIAVAAASVTVISIVGFQSGHRPKTTQHLAAVSGARGFVSATGRSTPIIIVGGSIEPQFGSPGQEGCNIRPVTTTPYVTTWRSYPARQLYSYDLWHDSRFYIEVCGFDGPKSQQVHPPTTRPQKLTPASAWAIDYADQKGHGAALICSDDNCSATQSGSQACQSIAPAGPVYVSLSNTGSASGNPASAAGPASSTLATAISRKWNEKKDNKGGIGVLTLQETSDHCDKSQYPNTRKVPCEKIKEIAISICAASGTSVGKTLTTYTCQKTAGCNVVIDNP